MVSDRMRMGIVLAALFVPWVAAVATPLGTAFTYQGSVPKNLAPNNGPANFVFTLYDSLTAGSVVAGPINRNGVNVDNGNFTVSLDFGAAPFNGQALWLEIAVTAKPANPPTTVSPRQPLLAVPFALYALDGAFPDPLWQSTGSDIYYNAGKVGIGNTAPQGLLDVGSRTPGAAVVDQSNTAAFNGSYRVTDWWQSFTAGMTGQMTALDFNSFFPGNGTLTIYAGEGTGTTPLLTQAVTLAPDAFGWTNLPLSTPINVNAGQRYTFAFSFPDIVGFPVNTDYPRGHIQYSTVQSVLFRTYVRPSGEGGLTVTADGQIGVGTTAPEYLVHVAGSGHTVVSGGSLGVTGSSSPLPASVGAGVFLEGNGAWANVFAFDYGASLPIPLLLNSPGGNVGIGTVSPTQGPLQIGDSTHPGNGAYCSAGGAWTNGSSRTFKENFRAIDSQEVLARLVAMPVLSWTYKNEKRAGKPAPSHLGPTAEDFQAAFGLGEDPQHIASLDEGGVALAAIQGLHQVIRQKNEQIDAQQGQIRELSQRLDHVQSQMDRLARLLRVTDENRAAGPAD